MKGLLAAMILSNALDAATTCYGVANGHAELNPIYGKHPSCERVVLIKGAATLATFAVAKGASKRHRRVILLTATLVNAAVVGWNFYQVSR